MAQQKAYKLQKITFFASLVCVFTTFFVPLQRISIISEDVEPSFETALGVSGQGNDTFSPLQAKTDNVTPTVCPPVIASTQNTPETEEKSQWVQPKKDEVAWYPMRIAYTQDSVAMRIHDFLKNEKNVEVFLPLEEKVTRLNGKRRKWLAPMFNSLIFIHHSQDEITKLKRFNRELLSLRYYTRHYTDDTPDEIIHIPEIQMTRFIKVASHQDGSIIPLGNDFSHKPGRRVRVIDGIFQGVEGKICRVKKDRRVVVTLEGICSVAISCISPDLLEFIDD